MLLQFGQVATLTYKLVFKGGCRDHVSKILKIHKRFQRLTQNDYSLENEDRELTTKIPLAKAQKERVSRFWLKNNRVPFSGQALS